jgi:hypothetical protein
MAQKLDRRETVSFEELLMSNVMEQGALMNLLGGLMVGKRDNGQL